MQSTVISGLSYWDFKWLLCSKVEACMQQGDQHEQIMHTHTRPLM